MDATELEQIARYLLAEVDSDAIFQAVTHISDQTLGKSYDVYLMTACSHSKERRWAMKQSADGYEAAVYRDLLVAHSLPTPEYHGSVTVSGSTWFLTDYLQGTDLRNGSVEQFERLMHSLARVHAAYWNAASATNTKLRPQADQIARTLGMLEQGIAAEVSSRALVGIRRALGRLNNGPLTLVHNDLLPINVIGQGGQIAIIDWGNCRYGHYATDLGRLLGDLQDEQREGWLPTAWHEQLTKVYHETLSSRLVNNPAIPDWLSFTIDLDCCRLWNYLGIVLSHLSHGWEQSDWYLANLAALVRTATDISDMGNRFFGPAPL